MNSRTLELFDRLDTLLGRLLCEVRFINSLLDVQSPETLEVRADDLAIVTDQVVRQLEAARSIARALDDATRRSNARRARRRR